MRMYVFLFSKNEHSDFHAYSCNTPGERSSQQRISDLLVLTNNTQIVNQEGKVKRNQTSPVIIISFHMGAKNHSDGEVCHEGYKRSEILRVCF